MQRHPIRDTAKPKVPLISLGCPHNRTVEAKIIQRLTHDVLFNLEQAFSSIKRELDSSHLITFVNYD